MLLGCIGDDFTGSSDLANVLAKGGMRTVQYSGVPDGSADQAVEAGIVALKSRTILAGEAVAQSLAALAWLREQGCRQFLFKYCSTFDSTPAGNIGPVAEALADALGAAHVVVCPAFPALRRSIYLGHLFVGDALLSESGMEKHPLTPMTDPNLRRWLSLQCRSSVGLVSTPIVLEGRDAIRTALVGSKDRFVIVDCLRDADLIEIAWAARDEPLITGGSGLALGLPAVFRARGEIGNEKVQWAPVTGGAVVLSGSCSVATRGQVEAHEGPKLEVTAAAVMDGTMTAAIAADWALAQGGLPLVYSSAEPDVIRVAQERFGREAIADRLERFMGDTARRLADAGVTRIVSAGGETSGAVVEALRARAMEIGPEIEPGVPALKVVGRHLALALKSGNFGTREFFAHAANALGHE